MPIDTDSELWKNTEYGESGREKIFEFLRSNPGQAFSVKEIAREVYDLDIGRDFTHKEESETEFMIRVLAEFTLDTSTRTYIEVELAALIDSGEVVKKSISSEEVSGQGEFEDEIVGYYTISG